MEKNYLLVNNCEILFNVINIVLLLSSFTTNLFNA